MKYIYTFYFLLCSFFINNLEARPINLVKDVDFSTFSLKYKGTIDNRLHISVFLNQVEDKINGIYYYDNNKYYLTLDGTISKTGHCIIFENNYKGKITGKFEGVLDNENFKGTWKNADNTKELSFELVNQAPLNTGDKGEAPLIKSKSSPFYVFVIGGLFAIGVGVLVYRKNKMKSISASEPAIEPVKETVTTNNNIDIDKLSSKIVQDLKDANVLAPTTSETLKDNVVLDAQETINKRKGDDFEKFIISKVPNKYWKLKTWRSDKYTDEHFPESNKYPDMEFEYKYFSYRTQFAIECKYRTNFIGGYVDICKPEKLDFYRQFQDEKEMDVYILLGVGGEPAIPKDLFLIPLSEIDSHKLHVDELDKRFKKPLKSMFFYKMDENRLS